MNQVEASRVHNEIHTIWKPCDACL